MAVLESKCGKSVCLCCVTKRVTHMNGVPGVQADVQGDERKTITFSTSLSVDV